MLRRYTNYIDGLFWCFYFLLRTLKNFWAHVSAAAASC